MSRTCFARLTRAASLMLVGLVAAACQFTDPGQPSGTNVIVPLRADTTLIGELVFFRSGVLGDTSRATGSRIYYRNTTSRTINNVSIAVHPAIQNQTPECLTPFRPSADTALGNVPPGTERTVQFGVFAPFVLLYVSGASDATRNFVSSLAGRWQGTATEFRGTSPTTRTVFGVSGSDGALVVYPQTITTDAWVATGNVGSARRLLGHGGVNCNTNWASVDSLTTLAVRADSLIYRGRATSAQGALSGVDSFAVRMARRP
jgi:hypothetical protein